MAARPRYASMWELTEAAAAGAAVGDGAFHRLYHLCLGTASEAVAGAALAAKYGVAGPQRVLCATNRVSGDQAW